MKILASWLVLITLAQPSLADNSKYFVFVGEKISVTAVPPKKDEIPFDRKYLAKYRVLEPYRGSYDGTEIEFTAFDHYGVPAFADHEHVLLFVVLHDGQYYHAKYQYNPLYKTRDGRWAGPYAANDYNHEYNKNTAIKPEPIDFAEPVVTRISSADKSDREKWLPEPYYRIEGRKAIAVYGNYVPELFLLKQNGVLKARGEFQ